MPPRLLIASNNKGKVAEFQALLAGCGWELVAPEELGLRLEVHETGRTYLENARIKARAFAGTSGLAALADDSGLEVDALSGEPGPLHHVLGWDGRNNNERIGLLLERLDGTIDRAARYKAVIVVALPDGGEIVGEGACEGEITQGPTGGSGFGYDPIFFVPSKAKTMAQLTFEEKNELSHRANAVAAVCPALRAAALRLQA